MAHELPALPYAVDALEVSIDKMTMEIHHGKHHAAYVANLNKALSDHPPTVIQNLLALESAMSEHLVDADDVRRVDAEARQGFARALEAERAAKGADKEAKLKVDVMKKCLAHLSEEKPVRTLSLDPNEKAAVREIGLLSAKPILYVANVDEGDLAILLSNSGATAELLRLLKVPHRKAPADVERRRIVAHPARLAEQRQRLLNREHSLLA